MKFWIRIILISIIGFYVGLHVGEALGKEYTETCGDYTPVSVLLKKYKPCEGGWCLR